MTEENPNPEPTPEPTPEPEPRSSSRGLGKPADGVPEEALSKFAVYDYGELRYLDGTFESAEAARKAHAETTKGKADRYKVRPV